jgi:hypothetical protein
MLKGEGADTEAANELTRWIEAQLLKLRAAQCRLQVGSIGTSL